MSAPDPVAALRAYMDGTGELPFKFRETCEALLAHVERLEAALAGLMTGSIEGEREAYRLGREIAGRKP